MNKITALYEKENKWLHYEVMMTYRVRNMLVVVYVEATLQQVRLQEDGRAFGKKQRMMENENFGFNQEKHRLRDPVKL